MSKALEIQKLCFSRGLDLLFQDLDLIVDQAEIVALLGASGAGKSTLLYLICGVLQAQQGQIMVLGNSALKAFSYISLLPQQDNLLPWRNVFDNVILSGELGLQPQNKKNLYEKAAFFLEAVGLYEQRFHMPEQLSYGMKQRVSLARAFVEDRPLLLLDEPFSGLDLLAREKLYEIVLQLNQQAHKTVILVTHDLHDALKLAHRVVVLNHKKIALDQQVSTSSYELLQQQLRQALESSYRVG